MRTKEEFCVRVSSAACKCSDKKLSKFQLNWTMANFIQIQTLSKAVLR